jgi:lysophospholipase L1-like esterase
MKPLSKENMRAILAFSVILALTALTSTCVGAEKQAASADRWETTIQKFEMEVRLHSSQPRGVVIYGSSSAVKWKPYQKDLGDVPITNRGFGGSTLAECARYVQRAVVPCKPAIVVFYGGDNDISQKAKPDDVLASFQTMLQRLRQELPDVKVVYVSIKPAPVRKTQYESLQTVNALLRDACQKGEGLYYLDIWTPMIGPDGLPNPDLFQEDRSHCNAKGYALWNSILKPLLDRLLAKPTGANK